MKKITAAAAATFISATLIAAPAQATQNTQQPTISSTAIKDYSKSKRNKFWRVVKNLEPSVTYAGKKATIKLGVGTCDYLRAGGDMYGLAMMVLETEAGVAEDAIIAVIAAAPVVLCPEQQYKFE